MIGLFAGSTSARLAAPGFNTLRLPSCGRMFSTASSSPMRPSSTSSMIAQVTKILVLENARKMWSGPERGVGLAIGEADALLIDDLTPAQHRPGHAGEDLPIDIALHRRPRGGKIGRPGVHELVLPELVEMDITTNRPWESLFARGLGPADSAHIFVSPRVHPVASNTTKSAAILPERPH